MAQSTQSGKQVGDKLKSHGTEGEREASGRQVGDKLVSHGPKHPEWEASGRQVEITWPREPRSKWGTSGRNYMAQGAQTEWQASGRQVGDKLKLHGTQSGKQVADKRETS